jgi:hypothetical protein
VTRISHLTASLASVLCMAAIFVWVAFAYGPPAQAQQPGKAGGQRAQGLCFLHTLVR